MSGQVALRLADLPLHGHPLALLQTDLPGDGDVGLLLLTRLEVDQESLDTPEGRERGVTFRHQQRAVQRHVSVNSTEDWMGGGQHGAPGGERVNKVSKQKVKCF